MLSNWITLFLYDPGRSLTELNVATRRRSRSIKRALHLFRRSFAGIRARLLLLLFPSPSPEMSYWDITTCWNLSSVYSITGNTRYKSRLWRCPRGPSGSLNFPLNLAAAGGKVSASCCCCGSLSARVLGCEIHLGWTRSCLTREKTED